MNARLSAAPADQCCSSMTPPFFFRRLHLTDPVGRYVFLLLTWTALPPQADPSLFSTLTFSLTPEPVRLLGVPESSFPFPCVTPCPIGPAQGASIQAICSPAPHYPASSRFLWGGWVLVLPLKWPSFLPPLDNLQPPFAYLPIIIAAFFFESVDQVWSSFGLSPG